MTDGSEQRTDKTLLNLLVGVEAGIVGACIMLIWFVLFMPILGEPSWLIPNLFASLYFSNERIYSGSGFATWVGVAMHLASCGLVGAFNGVLTPAGRLSGLATSFGWYLICYFWVWKRFAPGLLAVPQYSIIVAFFLFGSTLGWHRQLLAYAQSD
jgi:ribose/xylose/arabinose/galactoside ABC-type transport system permease subunit